MFLLNVYIASAITSLVMNNAKELKCIYKSKNKAYKELKYSDVCPVNYLYFKDIRNYFIKEYIILTFQDLVPIFNFVTSYYQMTCEEEIEEEYTNIFRDFVRIINEEETNERKEYAKILRDMIEKEEIQKEEIEELVSYTIFTEILSKNGYFLQEEVTQKEIIREINGNGKKLLYKKQYEE